MDNITHTLTAVLLSRAGLNRVSPHATVLLVLAANAADLDVATLLAGPAAYLRYHRGPLHSLVSMPFLALLVVAVARLVLRKKFSWPRAYLVSLVGVASNPLLDCLNPYGVRLLWPFSEQWFSANLVSIFDAWILLLLLLALFTPWLLGLVSSEIGAKKGTGQGMALFVLSLITLYGFGRYVTHTRAVAVLDSRLYQGQAPLRVAAFPTPANPFRWTGVVEGRDFMQIYPDLSLGEEFDPSQGDLFYKPDPRTEIEAARVTDSFQAFLAFSQWPLWRVTPGSQPEQSTQVEVLDLRFGTPQNPHFVATALFDSSGRLLSSGITF